MKQELFSKHHWWCLKFKTVKMNREINNQNEKWTVLDSYLELI